MLSLQFTNALYAISQVDPGSDIGKKLNDALISVLYGTVPHPPSSFVGSNVYFASEPSFWSGSSGTETPVISPRFFSNFRSADGSGNNPGIPFLGQAGTPYARSVQNKHPLPANALPNSGEVFDSLLKARDVSAASQTLFTLLTDYAISGALILEETLP